MSEPRQIGIVSDVPPGTARQFEVGDDLIVVVNTA